MDLTDSYLSVFPEHLLEKYTFLETRNAAAVFLASNPWQFDELLQVLDDFWIYDDDILIPGGNRGTIPARLDKAFEDRDWSAVRVDTEFRLVGRRKSRMVSRIYDVPFLETAVYNDGFEVDNMKGRVAIDVEWNAKDGNLDRDLSAYRSLYDLGLIDVATVITRDHRGIRHLAAVKLDSEDAYRRLGTTTTTNMEKIRPRMTRGDSGGCPLLAIGLSLNSWAGRGVATPSSAVPDIDPALL